jgi:hypothetical protein
MQLILEGVACKKICSGFSEAKSLQAINYSNHHKKIFSEIAEQFIFHLTLFLWFMSRKFGVHKYVPAGETPR